MKHRVYADFSKEKFNQTKNYEAILSKVKEKKMRKRRKIANMVAIFVVILLLGTASSQIYAKIKWNITFQKMEKNSIEETNETLNNAKTSGFAEKLGEDYTVQDGVGIKLDSLLLTDDCLNTRITFKFAEEKEVDSETFDFGYMIYDENKNIYDLQSRMHLDVEKEQNLKRAILQELDEKYAPNDVYPVLFSDNTIKQPVEITEDRTIVIDLTVHAKEKFPPSQKLYMQVFDLGYLMSNLEEFQGPVSLEEVETEDFVITPEKWILEKELPERFQERQTMELVLKDKIPDLELEKCTITETGMVLVFQSEKYVSLVKSGQDAKRDTLTVTDGEGNLHQDLESGLTKKNTYKMNIDAGKKDLDKKLFLNFTRDGKTYTSELVEK